MRLALALVLAVTACGSSSPPPGEIENRGRPDTPTTVAFLVNGMEIWLGNDDFETDEAARYTGALHAVKKAIDAARPPVGQGLLVTYDTAATVVVPLGPIERVTGASIGEQRAYRGRLGLDLVKGVEVALGELEKAPPGDRTLVVIGDGNDTNNDVAKGQLAALRARAERAGIRVEAVIWKGALSAPEDVVSSLDPTPTHVQAVDDMVAAVTAAVRR